MITMSLQTKLGDKVNILVDRVMELWNGKTDKKTKNNKNSNVKVSQPISGQQINNPVMSQSMYTDGTAISSLPSDDSSNTSTPSQQYPNYNNMYSQDTTPLVAAATPGGMAEGFSEPMAANSVLGGSFGSSW